MATPTDGDEQHPGPPPEVAGGSDFETAQRDVFEEAGIDVQSRFVDLTNPQTRTHVLQAGDLDDKPPVLFVHGTTWFAAYFAPLLAELEGARMLAIDRPGSGLSGDFGYTAANFRQTVSTVLGGVLDGLGIEQVDLVGNSMGGYWSIVFALAHPSRVRRLILLGAVPTFPETRIPLPLRLLTVPGLNRLLSRFQKPSAEGVVKQMEMMGEGDSIQRYPALIRAKVAHDRTPRSKGVSTGELRSLLTIRGSRSATRLREEELQDIQHSTLFIWGEHDPLGGPDTVRENVKEMPDARLEAVDAGHAPWFGHPEKCAMLIREMRS